MKNLELQAKTKIEALDLETLIQSFELTNGRNDESIPIVRDWLMDELENRNSEAFELWLDSCVDSPREFYV